MKSIRTSEKIDYFNQRGNKWDEIVGNNEERRLVIDSTFGMLNMKEGDSVLDAGCGNGILFDFIEEKIGETGCLLAVDAAPAMIERAKELYSRYRNIEYVVGLLESLSFDENSFDVVLCFSILPHVDDLPAVLSQFKKALKINGLLYIFHLSDTKSLNAFHSNLDGPVRYDLLPEKNEMVPMLERAGFLVMQYIDRTGLNFIECRA